MVMTQSQTGGAARTEAAEVFLYALSNRLQHFETARFLHRMDTDAFGRAVIDLAAKKVTTPSVAVKVAVASVPHIWSG
jgi:hypothetical protein